MAGSAPARSVLGSSVATEPASFTPVIGQIPISTTRGAVPAGPVRATCCKLSVDLARLMRILPALQAGEAKSIGICVTRQDVNTLYNPGYADYLGCHATFVVDEIVAGSQRVEITPNSRPGAKDGGIFRLYGRPGNPLVGISIPTNAWVTLCTVRA